MFNCSLTWPLEDIDDGTGIIKQGYLGQCSCGGDVFHIFLPIDGQNHMHLQCAQCEQTYCQLGTCQLTKIQEVTNER